MTGDALTVLVVDGASEDGTRDLASAKGAGVIQAPRGRGSQLAAGADTASEAGAGWLLFLHADTVLAHGWRREVTQFCAEPSNRERAGVFRFALDDGSKSARRLEAMVRWRTRVLGLPYGDQGLLIHHDFYQALGGFRPLPLMEDVDLVRRIGRHRLRTLNATATTSATRYRQRGYVLRAARNLFCLLLYFLRVPPRLIARIYG